MSEVTVENSHPLEAVIAYHFHDNALLVQALTHRSMTGHTNNDRLEFLGDAVLSLVVATTLIYGVDADEGTLTRKRAAVVSGDALAAVATRIGLGRHLLLGKGEARSGGRDKASLLAGAFEALVGAVYLDSGDFAVAAAVAERLLADELSLVTADTHAAPDAKTALQEWVQALAGEQPLPQYHLLHSDPQFHVRCTVADVVTEGQGRTRKIAEQIAAALALAQLRGETDVVVP